MKKAYTQLIKAIEVTKKYTADEVKKLSGLFLYLNNIDIHNEDFKTGISAK
jgi:stage V sporulation protein SpoVS